MCKYSTILLLLWAAGMVRTSPAVPTVALNADEFFSQLQVESFSSACSVQLKQLQQGLQQQAKWALQMIDAWGKYPAGILYGHTLEMGNYDECVRIEQTISTVSNENADFLGKYCLAKVRSLRLGVCIPNACEALQMSTALRQYLNTKYNLNESGTTDVVLSQCSLKVRQPYEAIDWAAIGVIGCLAFLVVASSIYDVMLDYVQITPQRILLSFSLRAHLRQLLSMQRSAKSAAISLDFMPCLHGMRSISLLWVILLHCCLMLRISANINTVDIATWSQTAFSMFLQTGTISVDTFLFLSGLLVTVVTLKSMSRTNGKLNIPIMFLHRVIRLTPTLAFAVLFFMSLYRYVGDGPLWQGFMGSTDLCKETWWATLLYVQNYAAAGKMCLGHTWYLAVDMQLYIISPLVLLVIWRWRFKGVAALMIVGVLMFACLFSTVMVNEVDVLKIFRNSGEDDPNMAKVYYTTHERVLPWIVGVVFGYFLYTHNGRHIQLSKWIICCGWSCSLAIILAVIFALYPKVQPDATPLTTLGGAFYLSLSRFLWPVALCWIVLACLNGYGGLVNEFLSSPVWQIISKLSYCMYIWHLPVVQANAGRSKVNTYFSNYDMILNFWSDFGVSLCVSTIVYVCIEAPTMTIDKILLGNKRTSPAQGTQQGQQGTHIAASQQQLCA